MLPSPLQSVLINIPDASLSTIKGARDGGLYHPYITPVKVKCRMWSNLIIGGGRECEKYNYVQLLDPAFMIC